ncbi:arabinose operon transcriptional regulator AraC [Mannheimia sp. HC-2023]|uniref:arabinose operon transcriptional regulator AraC n=1 Tax=Mannheimia indoligenes TaxID=3103145 RepID=UPI002FE66EE2
MREHKQDLQNNPLLPGYDFNAYLVAGCTQIEKSNELDFPIYRPNGMNGYILNLTIKGKGSVFQDDHQFDCKVGDLLLFPPNAVHDYRRSPDSDSWYHQWIYFRARTLWKDWLKWSDTVQNVGRLTIPNQKTYQNILDLFQKIEKEYNSNRLFSEAMSMCLLEQLIITCIELEPSNQKRKIEPRILDVCNLISQDIHINHKIEELAEYIHISPSRLTHLFVEQVGTSIVKWREEQRMIRARHLLHTSNAPIYHIARQLGYDDQLYFTRLFKRYTGLSPSAFRDSR